MKPTHLKRSATEPYQSLFVLYLPRPGPTLQGSVHRTSVRVHGMFIEALYQFGINCVLVPDCDYPAARLVALINAHGVRFIMRSGNDSG